MSVQLETLAEEVFDAAAAAGGAGARVIRLPYGRIVTHPDFPDVFSLHALAGLHAPDWPVDRLEGVLRAQLPAARFDRVQTRDPRTRDGLGPRLLAAGYRPEHKVAMLEVAEPAFAPAVPVRLRPVETPSDWRVLEGMLRSEWQDFPAATVEQVLRLERMQADAGADHPVLALLDDRPLGHVSVVPERSLTYVHALHVVPAARRRGLATAVMLALRGLARSTGGARLGLLCLRDSWLPAFYRRLGYVAVGEEWTWMKAR